MTKVDSDFLSKSKTKGSSAITSLNKQATNTTLRKMDMQIKMPGKNRTSKNVDTFCKMSSVKFYPILM